MSDAIILPTKSTPEDTRKMGLDIMSKMPSSKGEVSKTTDKDFIFSPTDGITLLYVKTSTSERTVRWPRGKSCIGQIREVRKLDSGTGEVKHALENKLDKFYYPGNTSGVVNMWTGRSLQGTVFRARTDGWEWVSGVIQPVALEPDIGSGWHIRNVVIVNVDPADSLDHEVTLSTLPDGTGMIHGNGDFDPDATVGRFIIVKSEDGTIWSVIRSYAASYTGYGLFTVPLDSSKKFKYTASSSAITRLALTQNMYLI